MAAGPFVGIIKNIILICGIMAWVMGSVVDKLIVSMNTYGMGVDATNTIIYMTWIFKAFPFLYFLALGINYWVESNNQSTGRI